MFRLFLLGLLFRSLVALLMAVAWLDRTFRRRLPFPRDPRELAEQRPWCLQQLVQAGLLPVGAQVTGFAVEPFKTGEAFRSLCAKVRVDWLDGTTPQTLQVLAKFAPRAENLRDHAIFLLQQNGLKEVGVYANLADEPQVAMPRPYFAQTHSGTGNLCIVMELMQGTVEISERQGCPPERCEQAIDALAELHAAFWQKEDPRAAFLRHVPDAVIDYLGSLFEGPDRKLLGQGLGMVWRRDNQAPTTVLHGDARVANMLFPKESSEGQASPGRFVFIDWQAARKGKGAFDVAYFLVLSVEPEVRRAHSGRLLDRYHAKLLAGGVRDYSREALEDDYRFACLLTLGFVSLPLLSAESSATSANAAGLADLGEVWTRRMEGMVEDLDYGWIEARTGLDAAAVKLAYLRSGREGRG